MTKQQLNVILDMSANKIIINNMRNANPNITIKSIIFEKEQYLLLKDRIAKRFLQLKRKEYSFKLFKEWSLLAVIFGIFTSYGDKNATQLFMECLMCNFLPKIAVFEHQNHIKICICIKEKELDEQRRECKNTG